MRAANQLAVQIDSLGSSPDLVVLSIGHASPPILQGTDAQIREALARIEQVPVQPVARVSVSIGRLKEWAELLQQTVDQIEGLQRGKEES